MTYHRRIIDTLLQELVTHPVAVALEGAKGVGKTASAQEYAATIFRLDDMSQRQLLEANPDAIITSPGPVLIDEWQLFPPIWDRVRRAVDDQEQKTFILTGSAQAAPGIRLHSGAGRIIRIPMRPMSFFERELVKATVSISDLFEQGAESVVGVSAFTLSDYVDEIYRSGFPGLRQLPEKIRNLQLSSYVDRLMDSELAESGVMVRRPDALKRWLTAYASATSTNASYATILNAATAGEPEKPARSTVDSYREHLSRLFILDPIPAWSSTFSSINRLTIAPKHHLAEPALAAILMGVKQESLLTGTDAPIVVPRSGTWLGSLFESLVTQSLRIYAWANDATIGHLRTKNTAQEIDLILERSDGGLIAIEIKLSATVTDRDVRHLHWFANELGDRVKARIVITTGQHAFVRPDGIAVIPFALLKP